MGVNELKLLAKRYLNGTASADEQERLNQWYEAIHAGGIEEIDTDGNETEAQVKQRIFENIQKRMHADNAPEKKVSPKYNVKQLWLRIASVAALLAIVCYVALPPLRGMISERGNQVVSVPSNRVLHITLPDSSKVWLNAGAIFRYPKSFDGKTRLVELVKGRAFFDIKHQSKHPFIVKTPSMNITVLGTTFDVNSDEKLCTTSVSVVTGKVGITMADTKVKRQPIMLLPQQQAVLSYATNQIITQPIHETAINAWCKNNFVFDQESLGNVFNALEKEYNTKITVENKELLNERISIKLGNQHLDTIMEILSFTKHFKYQIANDSTVVVK
jgi:transmembrane sensor